jgi:hypothetical protein
MLGSRAMPAAQITLTPKSEVLRELIVVKGLRVLDSDARCNGGRRLILAALLRLTRDDVSPVRGP